jgi:hypothetical protein
MNLVERVPAGTDGARQFSFWRDRLIAVGQTEPRPCHLNAGEVPLPLARRINDFVTGHCPDLVCDRCICEALDFYSSAQAAQITEALATTSDFERRHSQCALCNNERIVVRAKSGPPIQAST